MSSGERDDLHRDPQDDRLEHELDRVVDSIRDDVPDGATLDAAAGRVWQTIAAASAERADELALRGCEDYARAIPDYLAGRLTGARRMLVADHLGECVTCRRELRREKAGVGRVAPAARAAGGRPWFRRTAGQLAAAAAIVVAVLGLSVQTDVLSIESHGLITIEAIEGELLRVGDDGVEPLAAGDVLRLEDGEQIRTAKGSSASIRLADDSAVELNERTELAVLERRPLIPLRQTDGRIALERGSIIVEASEQGAGRLYVDTADCTTAVQGTVFAVNHGMKGSRVSVIEGEVQVDLGRNRYVLTPGDQTTTSEALARIPVEDEIAWSRNLEKHVALLREMKALGREMDRALRASSRYDTAQLDLVPAGTAFYVAAPNLSRGLADAYEILLDRVASNPALAEWWGAAVDDGEAREHLDLVVERVREYGDHLGEEIVLTMQLDDEGTPLAPLIVAPLTDAAGLRALIEREAVDARGLYLFEGDALPIDGYPPDGFFVWIRDDLVAVTPQLERLYALSAVLGGTRGTALDGAFRERLAERYDRGVEWLVGVDLGAILAAPLRDEQADAPLEQLGLAEARFLIAERLQRDERAEHRADLYFDGPRRNIAAWLAEPAPLGGLGYVSPDAHVVGGFVMKEMGIVVDEMLDFVADNNDGFEAELAAFEAEHGIDVRGDLAGPLGGEFVFAFDGPLLPTPSWTFVAEIYDPTRFDRSVEWLVEKAGEAAAEAGHDLAGVRFAVEQAGGRTFRRVESIATGFGATYTVDDGYLVAGPTRAAVDRALRVRAGGLTLVDSPRFAELMPHGEEIDFSAVLYQNLGPVLGSVMGTLGATGATLAPEQQQLAQALASESEPSLALVYGGRERISIVGVSEGGLFSSGLGSMVSLPSFAGVQESLMQAHAREAAAIGDGS